MPTVGVIREDLMEPVLSCLGRLIMDGSGLLVELKIRLRRDTD
jgi:hypothetical protein